jgi:hypothetical protein
MTISDSSMKDYRANNFAVFRNHFIMDTYIRDVDRAPTRSTLFLPGLISDRIVARRSFLFALGLLICIRDIVINKDRIGVGLSNRPAMFSRKLQSNT